MIPTPWVALVLALATFRLSSWLRGFRRVDPYLIEIGGELYANITLSAAYRLNCGCRDAVTEWMLDILALDKEDRVAA